MANKREDRWSKKPLSMRCLIIAAVILLCILVALIVAAALTSKKPEPIVICNSKECLQTAYDTLFLLNPYKDPCKDFYEFACGDFVQFNSLPIGKNVWTSKDEARSQVLNKIRNLLNEGDDDDIEAVKKLKMAYKSCYKTGESGEDSVPMLKQMMEVMGMPLSALARPRMDWLDSDFNLTVVLASLHAASVEPFFTFSSIPWERDNYVLAIKPSKVYEGIDTSKPEQVEVYKQLLTRVLRKFELTPEVEDDVNNLVEMDRGLQKMKIDRCEMHGAPKSSNVTALRELPRNPAIKWVPMLRLLYETLRMSYNPADIKVWMSCPEYIEKLGNFLNWQPSRSTALYLTVRFALATIQYAEPDLRQYTDLFRLQLNPPTTEGAEIPPVKESCIDAVDRWMPEALTYLYLKKELKDDREQEVKKYFENLKKAYIDSVKKQGWIDEPTRRIFEQKFKAQRLNLASPPGFMSGEGLNEEYRNIEIVNGSFLTNALSLMREQMVRTLISLHEPTPLPEGWPYSPLTFETSSPWRREDIDVPVGLSEDPYFLFNRPLYMNYGGIGFLMAQQLQQSFYIQKDIGRDVEPSEETIKKLEETLKCFLKNYKLEGDDAEEYAQNTVLQNMADTAAFQHVYKAYLEVEASNGEEPMIPGVNYTNHQLLFIQMAQSNCEIYNEEGRSQMIKSYEGLGKIRTNGMAKNSPEFAKVFNCKWGSPMNPTEKCRLWK